MIRFSCKCGFEFNLTEDHAGEVRQCSRCGLLVDVPSSDELAWLAEDGTIGLDASAADGRREPGLSLAEMYRAYSRNRTDADGNPIDLRNENDHLSGAGQIDAQGHRPERIAPRYDPETGERIIPLALKDETPRPVLSVAEIVDPDEDIPLAEAVPPRPTAKPAAQPHRRPRGTQPVPVQPLPVEPIAVEPIPVQPIPVQPARPGARVRSLTYATGDAARPTSPATVAVDLLVRPANLIVLLFVGWFYVGAYLLKIPLNAFAYVAGLPPLVTQVLNLPLLALVAHYGCVVEDIGPDGVDELPRPLRNFAFGDDLFAPGVRVLLAVALCYGPAIVCGAITHMDRPPTIAITLSLAAVGTYAFPAVVLTLLTGSTVLNLAPRRLLGVVAQCGAGYIASVFLAGGAVFGTAFFLLGPSTLPALANVRGTAYTARLALLVPALGLTMYLSHLFAWHLGLLYREHHDQFPWVGQRHIRLPRAARPTPPLR